MHSGPRKIPFFERVRTTPKWNFATKDGNISLSLSLYTMRLRFSFSKPVILGIYIAIAAIIPAFSQTAPRQEKLLNGLKILMWSLPNANNVTVKLRIHAGASFDQQQKEGTMCMLAEALFPTKESREFFSDDLGGSFKITCNYDYIEIDGSSKPESYLTLLETIAAAVSNPTLDQQTTDVVRTRVVAQIAADEKNAGYAADLAARKRLFGTFPYGRAVYGTQESVKKVDFAELKFAYDRLFGADNATIAVSGNFPPDVAYRGIRRFFGSWLKSDRKVPSTFRQPDEPVAGTQVLESPAVNGTEIRYAFRGVARNDREFAAAKVAANILEQRVRAKAPGGQKDNVWVRSYSNVLPGIIIIGFSNIQREITAAVINDPPKQEANDIIANALSGRITDAEFIAAKNSVSSEIAAQDVATRWLDADTYKLASVKADQNSIDSVSLPGVQSFADRIKLQPVASVLLLTRKNSN
jgi:predicted Zn-dependent peptidase